MIQFGTDGWRDIIAEDFTYDNVRKVAQAHAQYLKKQGGTRVVVGYDTRFQADGFAQVAAETMAANGLETMLAREYTPTPVLSFAVVHYQAAGGVMITASHNPPKYCGYKIKGAYGGSATPAIVSGIEAELAGPLSPSDSAPIDEFDVREEYYLALDRLLDLELFRRSGGLMYHDAMGGAGAGWLEGYVRHAKLPLTLRPLHGVANPTFYGVNPEPVAANLGSLLTVLQGEAPPVFGAVTDGDADRIGAAVAGGAYFNSHKIFAVLLQHLAGRGLRGRVVKTVSGSRIIGLLAQALDLELLETAVGFKYITDAFLHGLRHPEHSVLIGGEESGGIAVQGHIPERDGLLNALLLQEAILRSGRSLPELFSDIEELTGFQHFYDRNDLHLPPDFDKAQALRAAQGWSELAGERITEISTADGVKLTLEHGGWVLLRASGTEPLIRIYSEANDSDLQQATLAEATRRTLAG